MHAKLRAIPVSDRAWLLAALADALAGGAAILPLAPEVPAAELARLQQAELPAHTAVVVRTSGSSGQAKAVALSAAALQASAEATHRALGGSGQWLVTLPTSLISGLQMLVRSHLADTNPVFLDGPFDPAALIEAAWQMSHERRYLSLVPVQLARLLDLAEADAAAAEVLRGFAAVLTGGQALPLQLRCRAHDLGVPLRRSYGMTESAGGCVYDGVEIGDTQLRIRGGEVQIAGSCLALGYLGDPALTHERFIEDQGKRWYRSGDAGELLGGMLQVTGRLDRVIISGGVNVSLDEVERVVQALAGWQSVVAIALPDAVWGERIGLVSEPSPDALTFAQVQAHVKQRLGAAAAPVWATELAQLPRLSGGKPDMQKIEHWVADLRESYRRLDTPGSRDQ